MSKTALRFAASRMPWTLRERKLIMREERRKKEKTMTGEVQGI